MARISSSFFCNSAKWFERFASNVCWNDTCAEIQYKLSALKYFATECDDDECHLLAYCHCRHPKIPFVPNAFADTIRSVAYASSRAYLPYSYESTSHEVSQNRNVTHFRLHKRKPQSVIRRRLLLSPLTVWLDSPWTVPHGYWRARTFLLPNRTNSVLPTTANGTWVFIDVFTAETDSSSVGNW